VPPVRPSPDRPGDPRGPGAGDVPVLSPLGTDHEAAGSAPAAAAAGEGIGRPAVITAVAFAVVAALVAAMLIGAR